MPAYVRRPHDEWLRAVLDPETIYNRLVLIRGDALTGTSRAASAAAFGGYSSAQSASTSVTAS